MNNGDILSGVFTNVGTFQVSGGDTAFIEAGTAFSMMATTINILGTLNGVGAGLAGGAAGAHGAAGACLNGTQSGITGAGALMAALSLGPVAVAMAGMAATAARDFPVVQRQEGPEAWPLAMR